MKILLATGVAALVLGMSGEAMAQRVHGGSRGPAVAAHRGVAMAARGGYWGGRHWVGAPVRGWRPYYRYGYRYPYRYWPRVGFFLGAAYPLYPVPHYAYVAPAYGYAYPAYPYVERGCRCEGPPPPPPRRHVAPPPPPAPPQSEALPQANVPEHERERG